MVTIRLEIERIDYEKSIELLLPQVIDRCSKAKEPGELEKFIAKLGSDAVPVTKKLLGYLADTVKDEIIVWLADVHREKLVKASNQALEGLCAGKAICIGDLSAVDRPGPRLAIQASEVSIDYPALLKSPLMESAIDQIGADGSIKKGAARVAVDLGSRINLENLEKRAVTLLTTERVKGKLLTALSEALIKIGLVVAFRDLILWTDAAPALYNESDTSLKDEGLFPDSFEDPLMDALCAYLKDSLS